MHASLLKSLLPGLVAHTARDRFDVVDKGAYLRLIDDVGGEEFAVEYRPRQLSNKSTAETPQIRISHTLVSKLIERCENPGGSQSPLTPALGYVWTPVDKSCVGFCVVPLQAFDAGADYVGRGQALNVTKTGYHLNTDRFDGFLSGRYPCLIAGKVKIDGFVFGE